VGPEDILKSLKEFEGFLAPFESVLELPSTA